MHHAAGAFPGMRAVWRLLAALGVAFTLGGCVSDEAAFVHSVWRPADGAPAVRDVYFVTDRERDVQWGGYGKHWSDSTSCGIRRATIPPANLAGEPPANGTIARVPGVPDLACATEAGPMAAIVQMISDAAARKNCRAVLLYVHGFNTLFDDAARRAGQLASDTQFPCVAAMFSWSSEGEVDRYAADIEHSAYSVPALEAFLRALGKAGLRVSIVAHSIGTRVTLSALSSLAAHEDPPPENFIDQLVLAAADVGADPVNNDFVHLVKDALPFTHRLTVYASSGDAVLAVSAVAHGNVPRAGHRPNGDRKLETPGAAEHVVDVINATDAPAELLGHSYFGLSYEAISDIALSLQGVPVTARLAPNGAWPATLACRARDGGPCDPALPRYVLVVSDARKPDWVTRLIRKLVPVLPRIELAPLTGGE
jgi:esterase/lipase superfamily enzyme